MSTTSTVIDPSRQVVSTVISGPGVRACRWIWMAFISRLTKTCCSWIRSAETCAAASAGTTVSLILPRFRSCATNCAASVRISATETGARTLSRFAAMRRVRSMMSPARVT